MTHTIDPSTLRRRRRGALLLGAVPSLALAASALGGDGGGTFYEFVGCGSETCGWSNPANWSPPGVPEAGDIVSLGGSVIISEDIEIGSLEMLGGSRVTIGAGFTLSVSGSASFNGDLGGGDGFSSIFGDGTLELNGPSQFSSITFDDTGGEPTLVINDSLITINDTAWNWMFIGSGDVVVNGSLVLGGATSPNNRISCRSLVVSSGGSLTMNSNYVISPQTDVVVDGSIVVNTVPGTQAIINGLRQGVGSTIDVLTGRLEVRSAPGAPPYLLEGAIAVSEDAVFSVATNDVDYRLTPDGSITGAGDVLLGRLAMQDATIEAAVVPSTTTVLQLVGANTIGDLEMGGGLVTGSGSLDVLGTSDLNGGPVNLSITGGAIVALTGPSSIGRLAVNDGLLEIRGDATCGIDNRNLAQTTNGTIEVLEGATLTIEGQPTSIGGTSGNFINRGTVVRDGTGDAFVQALQNLGLVELVNGNFYNLGSAVSTGDTIVGADCIYKIDAFGATPSWGPDSTWTGAGTLEVVSATSADRPIINGTVELGALVLDGLGLRIEFNGDTTFGTGFFNRGTLVGSGDVRFTGLFEADGANFTDSSGRVVCSGPSIWNGNTFNLRTVVIEGDAVVNGGILSSSDATDGIEIAPGGSIELTDVGSLKGRIVNDGLVRKTGAGVSRIDNNSGFRLFSNTGDVVVEDGTFVTNQITFSQSADGRFVLAGGEHRNDQDSLPVGGGRLEGFGLNDATTTIGDATLAPGVGPNDTGILAIENDLTLGECSVVEIELGGLDPGTGHDQVAVLFTANLNGVLSIRNRAKYVPTPGDVFTILTGATVLGGFDQIVGPDAYAVNVFPDRVELTVLSTGCAGDIDRDGVVTAADLAVLLGAWGACPTGAPPCEDFCPADLDGNGVVDAADLGILLGAWGLCP